MRAISRTIILTVTFLFATGALLATTPAISAEKNRRLKRSSLMSMSSMARPTNSPWA
jgi:hypothetical protein